VVDNRIDSKGYQADIFPAKTFPGFLPPSLKEVDVSWHHSPGYMLIQLIQYSTPIKSSYDVHGPDLLYFQLFLLLTYSLEVSPDQSELVSETSSQWLRGNLVVCPHSDVRFEHVVGGYRVSRIGGSNGIGRVFHLYVFYRSQLMSISGWVLPYLICLARCSLRVKLRLQGGYSVQ
jgi:hypothetical protein